VFFGTCWSCPLFSFYSIFTLFRCIKSIKKLPPMGDGIFFQTKTISGIFSWDMLVVGVYTSLLIQYYSYAKNNLTFLDFTIYRNEVGTKLDGIMPFLNSEVDCCKIVSPVEVDCCKIVGGFQIKERPQLMEDCVNESCNSPGSSKYSFHNLDSDGKRISPPNSK